MEIHVYHSSSLGNLYRLNDLILEAGVSIKEIKKCLGYKLHKMTACLVTHEHGDHARGAKDLLKCGVDVYCSEGTADALELAGHRLHILENQKPVTIGGWRVLPFHVPHNAREPMGFLLGKDDERVLFVTDALYVPWKFKGLTRIMIETDYDPDILRGNICRGRMDMEVGKRVIRNHMSFRTVRKFFEANDMSRVREICLLHLSQANSDSQKFRREIEKLTGIPVYLKE